MPPARNSSEWTHVLLCMCACVYVCMHTHAYIRVSDGALHSHTNEYLHIHPSHNTPHPHQSTLERTHAHTHKHTHRTSKGRVIMPRPRQVAVGPDQINGAARRSPEVHTLLYDSPCTRAREQLPKGRSVHALSGMGQAHGVLAAHRTC